MYPTDNFLDGLAKRKERTYDFPDFFIDNFVCMKFINIQGRYLL